MQNLYVVDGRLSGTYQNIEDDQLSTKVITEDGKRVGLTRMTITDHNGTRTEVLASPTSCYSRVKEAFLAVHAQREATPAPVEEPVDAGTMSSDETIQPQLFEEVADEHDPDVDDGGDLARGSDGRDEGSDPA